MKVKESYICQSCALLSGAQFPKSHICTHHKSKCPYCNEKKSLCHTSDYDWPNNKELEKNREI